MPAEHPAAGPEIALSALAGERWVAGYLDTACHRVVVTACRAAGFEPRIVARSNDFRVVLALVAAGQGVALVPGLAVDRLPDGVCLARPAERRLARRVVGAVRAGGGGHPAVAALLDALREAAGHGAGPGRAGARRRRLWATGGQSFSTSTAPVDIGCTLRW